jgi:hypothetical protein
MYQPSNPIGNILMIYIFYLFTVFIFLRQLFYIYESLFIHFFYCEFYF